jgi:hypothetical protein
VCRTLPFDENKNPLIVRWRGVCNILRIKYKTRANFQIFARVLHHLDLRVCYTLPDLWLLESPAGEISGGRRAGPEAGLVSADFFEFPCLDLRFEFFRFCILHLLTYSSITGTYPFLLVCILLLLVDAFLFHSRESPVSSPCCIDLERVAFALVFVVGRSGGVSIRFFSASKLAH